MSSVRIGDLRHRVTVEEPVRTPDGAGGATIAWTAITEVWGAIEPIDGAEGLSADRVSGHVSHRVTLRYLSVLEAKMRFRSGTRIFEIRAVRDEGERHRFHICHVEERDL